MLYFHEEKDCISEATDTAENRGQMNIRNLPELFSQVSSNEGLRIKETQKR
jgi:hypothetical protein